MNAISGKTRAKFHVMHHDENWDVVVRGIAIGVGDADIVMKFAMKQNFEI